MAKVKRFLRLSLLYKIIVKSLSTFVCFNLTQEIISSFDMISCNKLKHVTFMQGRRKIWKSGVASVIWWAQSEPPPLFEIMVTDLPKSGHPPGTTPLLRQWRYLWAEHLKSAERPFTIQFQTWSWKAIMKLFTTITTLGVIFGALLQARQVYKSYKYSIKGIKYKNSVTLSSPWPKS